MKSFLQVGLLCVFQFMLISKPQAIEAFEVRQSTSNSLEKNQQRTDDLPSCEIFCRGDLLHTVEMAHIYKDSKTFVDMKLKQPPNVTMEIFKKFMQSKNNAPKPEEIEAFVNENFEEKGKEFVSWVPEDWKENPRFLNMIRNEKLRKWANDLNGIWKILGRKMIPDVYEHPELYSIIPVNNPVIVPGGRFIEFYYWDSYWIMRGLLYSQMHNTVRGMLLNFMSMIQRFGLIPNGGRVYYLKRSQPPLLPAMIKSYVEFTKDEQFAVDSIPILVAEFEFFMNNHAVEVNGHQLFVYRDSSTGPRPESYREDYENAKFFDTAEKKQDFYSEIAAGAESGMDFTSRWFINSINGTNDGNLTDIKTRSIVAVELNAILYWNAKIIAEFYLLDNNGEKSAEYEGKAARILEAIQAVLWNEEAGVWLDYDLINKKPRNYFVPTNLSPLWTKAYNRADSEKISKSVIKYLKDLKIDSYPGGIPNTLQHSGEQWDWPNAWPLMQYIVVEGLANLRTTEATEMSKLFGYKWVQSNYQAYLSTNAMHEKYDASVFGGTGGGGEYETQLGFGWSNGVIIELLVKYGDDITPANGVSKTTTVMSLIMVTSIAVIVSVFGRFI
ncbi:trehalase-like [Episyrphus balteatus]|uniref:trehalase-like n=1 Tax=Episyrphus balteatus TaxID=286459 RepID=UPI00248698B6|nr:trehalase-like [Episyrphus balteatus]